MYFRIIAPILPVPLRVGTVVVRPPALGRRLDKCALLVVPCAQLARRLAVQMARGLFIATEITWPLVARLVSPCPVLLLLSGVLRGRHGDRRRRIRHAWRHLELGHGLLDRHCAAEAVHVGYVRVLHAGERRQRELQAEVATQAVAGWSRSDVTLRAERQ